MILKISNNGERIEFYHEDVTKHTTFDNVLLIGKGIREIVDDVHVRRELISKFGENGIVYLLSPEYRDIENQVIHVYSTSKAFDYNAVNLLDEIDLTTGIVPTILDRSKTEEET